MAILKQINWGWLNSCSFLEITIVELMVQMVQMILITIALTVTITQDNNSNNKNKWTNYNYNNNCVCYCTKYKLTEYRQRKKPLIIDTCCQ